ncbi:hypothetical protein YC2023_082431 [Brassica napus]
MKARRKWPRINGTKTNMLNAPPPPPCQKSRYNPEMRQEATATTSKPQGALSILKTIRRLARRPE